MCMVNGGVSSVGDRCWSEIIFRPNWIIIMNCLGIMKPISLPILAQLNGNRLMPKTGIVQQSNPFACNRSSAKLCAPNWMSSEYGMRSCFLSAAFYLFSQVNISAPGFIRTFVKLILQLKLTKKPSITQATKHSTPTSLPFPALQKLRKFEIIGFANFSSFFAPKYFNEAKQQEKKSRCISSGSQVTGK